MSSLELSQPVKRRGRLVQPRPPTNHCSFNRIGLLHPVPRPVSPLATERQSVRTIVIFTEQENLLARWWRALIELCKTKFASCHDVFAYSITSSARASSDGGTVRPNAFAVLRLITSSNFVGCSMGKSSALHT